MLLAGYDAARRCFVYLLGNSSKAKADSELTTQDGEDFKSFLENLLPVQPSSILVSSSH